MEKTEKSNSSKVKLYENRREQAGRFFEFVKAYVPRWQKFLWFMGIGYFLYGVWYVDIPLTKQILGMVLFSAAIVWFWGRIEKEVEWGSDKIRNLILYRQKTQTAFTPLEQKALDKYFGNVQRKALIFDHSDKNRWMKWIYLFNILGICGIIFGLYFGFYLPMRGK